MGALSRERSEIDLWRKTEQRVRDSLELCELGDASMRAELEHERRTGCAMDGARRLGAGGRSGGPRRLA